MKSRFFSSAKISGFEGQFKDLNDSEMINLRGGLETEPPLPPPSGEDLPIDLLKPNLSLLSVQKVPALPVLPCHTTGPRHKKK